MSNLTGKKRLYSCTENFIDKDLSVELQSLSMRLEIDDLYVRAVALDRAYRPVRNFFDMKENLFLYGEVHFLTLEGVVVEVSLKKESPNELPIHIPKGFIKRAILPLLDDEELFDISIRRATHFYNVFAKMDETLISQVIDYKDGTIGIDSDLNEEIYNTLCSSNILVNWGIDKKILVIDFIYSEGELDSGKLAIYIYAILKRRAFPKEFLNFIFSS